MLFAFRELYNIDKAQKVLAYPPASGRIFNLWWREGPVIVLVVFFLVFLLTRDDKFTDISVSLADNWLSLFLEQARRQCSLSFSVMLIGGSYSRVFDNMER